MTVQQIVDKFDSSSEYSRDAASQVWDTTSSTPLTFMHNAMPAQFHWETAARALWL